MTASIDTITLRLFQFALVSLALFVPFSIAGTNIALGFCGLAWVISAFLRRRDGFSGTVPMAVRQDPMFIASIVLVVSAVPSLLMSEDLSRAYRDWRSYWQLLIYFMIAGSIVAAGMREKVFWILLVSTTISCVVAFIQRAGGIDIGFVRIGGKHRVSSTMFTMTFSGILYLMIVNNVSAAMSPLRATRDRIIIAAATCVQFVAILLTMTRGAWLALVVGLGTVLVLLRNRLSLAVAVAAVVALLAFSFVFSIDQERNMSLTGLLSSGADFTVSTRLVLWDIAWELFKEHPLLGVGMGDYTIEANKLVAGRFVTTTVDSHNIVLQILATRGLVGFAGFVFFWTCLFRTLARARRRLQRGSVGYHYVVGAIAAAVAILVGSMTELAVDDSEIFMAFMVITGIAASSLYHPQSK